MSLYLIVNYVTNSKRGGAVLLEVQLQAFRHEQREKIRDKLSLYLIMNYVTNSKRGWGGVTGGTAPSIPPWTTVKDKRQNVPVLNYELRHEFEKGGLGVTGGTTPSIPPLTLHGTERSASCPVCFHPWNTNHGIFSVRSGLNTFFENLGECRSHLQDLGARRVTWRRLHTNDLQILRTAI
jgi:hypothetical protein